MDYSRVSIWPKTEADAEDGPMEERVFPCADDADWEPGRAEVESYDDDAVALHAFADHMLDDLTPTERRVVSARFGLDGQPVRSMRELHDELHIARSEVREALGNGLAKIRTHLRD